MLTPSHCIEDKTKLLESHNGENCRVIRVVTENSKVSYSIYGKLRIKGLFFYDVNFPDNWIRFTDDDIKKIYTSETGDIIIELN